MNRFAWRSLWSFRLTRIIGYVAGFLLFYAPFELFARVVDLLFPPEQLYSIHEPCFRIPLHLLLSGRIAEAGPVSLAALGLFLIVSFLFGPLLCGRLCPAGALPEFLSRLVPARFQIDWPKYVPVVPVRYGFFIGFLLAAFAGFSNHCAYCNFFVFDLLISAFHTGRIAVYSASLIGTFVVWFVLLGLFTKGGRGVCNFLCPVGAAGGLMHLAGRRLPFSFSMNVDGNACVGCGICQDQCPIRAVRIIQDKAVVSYSRCIVCGECAASCPGRAIRYGRQTREGQS